MRLHLGNLSSRDLQLWVPGPGGESSKAVLRRLEEASGLVETEGDTARLHPVTVREAEIAEGSWLFPFGAVEVARPGVIRGAELDFSVGPRGFDGLLSFAGVNAAELGFDFHGPTLRGAAELENVVVEHHDASGHASAERFRIEDVVFAMGDMTIRGAALEAFGVRVRWSAGGSWAVEADRLTLERATLIVEHQGVELELESAEIPHWLSVRGDAVRIGSLAIGRASLRVRELSTLGSARRAGTETGGDAGNGGGGSSPLEVDHRLLDRLDGQLDVDLTLDATVPLIGRRKATHHFRVPIREGTINYRSLERDLAALEDAVIDFAVRGGRLVLERDLLLPGLNKPILIWDLSEVELALARERLVRLRTLPNFRLPSKDPDVKKSRFSLRRVHFRNLEVDLALLPRPNAGPLDGVIPDASIEELTLRGEIHHHTERQIEQTELLLRGRRLALVLTALPVADFSLDVESLNVETFDEVILRFDHFNPTELTAALSGLSGRSISLTRAPGPDVES